MTSQAGQSLQNKIDEHGNLWSMLYDGEVHRFQFPVKPEYSNWIDEQIAWRTSVIFQNTSHHMTDVFLEGPDVIRLLSDLGINSFHGFGPMQAKQYVVCNHDGYVIGDAVLFCEKEDEISIVGKPMAANWVRFHAEIGDYSVKVTKIDRPPPNLTERTRFRFQVPGPKADQLFEELNGGPFATTMLREGYDAKTVAASGGWKDAATAMRYYAHALENPTVTDVLFGAKPTQGRN